MTRMFPFIKRRQRREIEWLTHSLSSLPVCLARALAMLLTSLTAEPTIQRYEDKGRGRNTLSRTFVSCPYHLLVKLVVEPMTSGDSRFLECCLLEGVHDGDEEENISRTPVISWEK